MKKIKLTKTASGNKVVKMSKQQWLDLGKKAGWNDYTDGSYDRPLTAEEQQARTYWQDKMQTIRKILSSARDEADMNEIEYEESACPLGPSHYGVSLLSGGGYSPECPFCGKEEHT